MSAYFKKVMDSAHKYSIFDFGIVKTMLITFGILIGLYLPIPLFRIIWLIILIFGLSLAWTVYITFFRK
ncbi:MAG: hypothetical protein Q8S24_00540 [Eubacteriales bacterium]|nr:hypothetical protein [Eubacteriales bacterium]